MSRICAITGKRPSKGGRIIRKGLTKKSGGSGFLVKNTRRKFRPNVQRIRVKLPSGEVKRMWVSLRRLRLQSYQGLISKNNQNALES